MTIEFQVASCDDLSTQNRIFSTYFSEYEFVGCDVNSEDFMSYAKAQVTVPVVNSYDIFNNSGDIACLAAFLRDFMSVFNEPDFKSNSSFKPFKLPTN